MQERGRRSRIRWSIGAKLAAASGLMILLALLTGGSGLWQALVLGGAVQDAIQAEERLTGSLELLASGRRLVAALDRMITSEDPTLASTEVPVALGALKFYVNSLQGSALEGEQAELLVGLQEAYGALQEAVVEVDVLARQGRWAEADAVLRGGVEPANDEMALYIRRLVSRSRQAAAITGAHSRAVARRAGILMAALLAVVTAFAVSWRQVVFQQMSHSIAQLRRGVARISSGDLTYKLYVRTGDEIEELGEEFNKMAAELKEMVDTLEERVAERTRDLERRAVQMAAAAEVAREAVAIRDVGKLLNQVVHLISERFGFYHAGIFLLDEPREYAVLRAASSEGGRRMLTRGHRLKVGEVGIVGWVAGAGQPRIALDVGEDAVFFDNPDLPQTRSEMALPLRVRGEVIGVLDVQSEQPAAFSEEDVAVLQTMADQVALAIENARLLEESQQALRELQSAYGEYVRATWQGLERLPAFEYDRVEVRPSELVPDPLVEKALNEKGVVAVNDPQNGRSALVAPLRLRDQLIGALALEERNAVRPWSDEEVELLQAVSEQVALALENARLFEETRIHAAELATLNELVQSLTARLNLEEVLIEAYQGASRLLDTTNFYVALYDPGAGVVSFPLAIEDGQPVQWSSRPLGNGLTEYVMRSRKPLLIRENLPERLKEMGVDMIGRTALSWLGVPLILGDRVLGVMAVQSYTNPHAYDEHTVNLMTAIASQAAIAIQNAHLFEETQAALAETEALYEAIAELNAAQTYPDILAVLRRHTVLGQADRNLTIDLFDQPWTSERMPEWIEVQARWITPTEDSIPTRYSIHEFPSAPVILRPDRPTLIPDVETDPRLGERVRSLFLKAFQARCVVFVPLVVGGQWIGYINGLYSVPFQFPEEEVRQLMSLAGQAAVAVQSIRRLEETQRRATQLAAAAEVARDATAILDVKQLLDETVHLISEQFGYYHAGVFLLDEQGEYAVLQAASSEGGERMLARGHQLKVGEVGIVGYVAGTGEPRIALDVGEDAVHFANPDLPDTRSELAIPLISRGRIIGVLDVQSTRAAAFSEEDVAVLRTMADQLATAIENARLFEATEQSLRETHDLFEASQAIGAAASSSEVGQALVNYAANTDLDFARLILYEYEEEEPVAAVLAEGWSVDGQAHFDVGVRVEITEFALSQLARPSEVIVIEDIHADDRLDERTLLLLEVAQVRSAVFIPLVVGRRQIGVLLVGRRQPPACSGRLIQNLQTLCGQAAIAMENMRLLEETRRRARELEVINELGRAMTSVLDLDTLVRQIVDTTKERFGQYYVSLFLMEGDQLVLLDGSEIGDTGRRIESRGLVLDLDEPGLTCAAVRAGQPVLVNDVLSDPRYLSVPELEDVRSELDIPIEVKGQVIGVMSVQSDRLNAYTQTDVLLLQSLVAQAGVAIENARLFAEMEAEARRRALIGEVLQAAATTMDPEGLLHRAGETIARNLSLPSAIFLWEPEVEMFRPVAIHAADGSDVPVEEGTWITRADNPFMFQALEQRQVQSFEAAAVAGPCADLARHLRVDSGFYVPLFSRDRVFGVLGFLHLEGRPAFSPEILGFVGIVGANLSVVLDNAYLYREAVETAERLREVDRLKSQFLANMSHELRTPLNSIIGFSRVILKGIDGPITDMQRQDLEAIYNSGQHLLGLINDILDISKIEAGKMELSFESVDIAEVIRGVMSTAVALVKDKPVELQQSVPEDLPTIVADGRRIRQVLLNLVSNAAKFTDEGFIRVEAQANEEFVTISVADSGIGIPEEKLPRIFEAFTQVDSSPSRKYGGTGLGLTISRSFVELHGGRIWVESEVGKGSTFYIALPIQGPPRDQQEPAVVEEEPAPEKPAERGGKRVLCVDDDRGVITLFRRYLNKQGYQVIGLTDPSRTVEEAKRIKPYAITLDVMMPGKDGWEVIQELKADPETKDIPVVMCTIVGEEERGLSLGAADYLVKPILEQDLLAALGRLDREEGRHRVLVVDDQKEDRDLLRRIVESQGGYEVVEAASGQEAIALVHRMRPHIIILDLLMPEVDGFAVLEAVKMDRTTRSIPIIVVTAKELTEEDRRLLNDRIEALIQKGGLDREELLEDVAAALKKLGRRVQEV